MGRPPRSDDPAPRIPARGRDPGPSEYPRGTPRRGRDPAPTAAPDAGDAQRRGGGDAERSVEIGARLRYAYETSNGRELTILLYVNAGWTGADGGALVLHGLEGAEAPEEILPAAGRVVAFFSRTAWHEVRPSATRRRFALTLWCDRA